MSKSRVQLWRGVIGAKRMRFDRISIRVLESILGEITPFHRCLFSYPRHLHQPAFHTVGHIFTSSSCPPFSFSSIYERNF